MIELPHKRFHMLLHGHVLDRLRELPDESVDCIMTSPPYFSLRFYKAAESIWGGDPNCDHDFSNAQPADLLHENRNNRRGTQEEVAANPTGTTYIRKRRVDATGSQRNRKGLNKYAEKLDGVQRNSERAYEPVDPNDQALCLKCGAWRGQLGLEPDFGMYLDHLLMVTAELKRVLKKSGTLWWNMGDTYSGKPTGTFNGGGVQFEGRDMIGIESSGQIDKTLSGIPAKSLMLMPERLAMRMVDEQQWVLRNMNIWHKPNHMPSSVSDRLSNSYEFVMLFTKAQRYFFDLDAIRVPLSPVTLKEIEKEYNGTSLKDYGGAMAQDASESKRRIVKSLQKYRSGNAERKTEQFRLSHLGSSIPWSAEDSPGGKNPGDVVEFFREKGSGGNYDYDGINSKDGSHYHELGKNPGDVFATKHDEAVGRTSGSYKDPLHTKAYHPSGKNPGDTMDYAEWYFNGREKKSWHDHKDDMEKGMHHTGHMESIPHPFGKHPDDFWEINPRPHPFAHFAVYPVELCIMPIKAGCPKDGVVLDPFAGSGTTGVAARQLGRSSILIEVSDEYCKIAKQRMEWGQQTLDGTEWIEE
jgi:DNA modification methylase